MSGRAERSPSDLRGIAGYSRRREPYNFPYAIRRTLLASAGGLCIRCHERPAAAVDHIVPVVLGGNGSQDNGRPLCLGCHALKTATERNWGIFGHKVISWPIGEHLSNHEPIFAGGQVYWPADGVFPRSPFRLYERRQLTTIEEVMGEETQLGAMTPGLAKLALSLSSSWCFRAQLETWPEALLAYVNAVARAVNLPLLTTLPELHPTRLGSFLSGTDARKHETDSA